MTTGMPISLSCRVRYIEFVSTKFGVRSSEPMAMISADNIFLRKRLAGDAELHAIERSGIDNKQIVFVIERESDETHPCDNRFGIGSAKSEDTAAPAVRR